MNTVNTSNIKAFEQDFKAACIKHEIVAAFVLLEGNDAKGSVLMIGGCTELSDFIERSLLPNTVEARENNH